MKNLFRPGVLPSSLNVLLPFDKDTWILLFLTLFSLGVILPVLSAAATNALTVLFFYKKKTCDTPCQSKHYFSDGRLCKICTDAFGHFVPGTFCVFIGCLL